MVKTHTPQRADDAGRFASAEACFERMRPALEALAAEQLKQPNLDLQQGAVVALRVDERLREPAAFRCTVGARGRGPERSACARCAAEV